MSELDKWLCGVLYVLVVGMLILAGIIAWGKVEQNTSYGLPEVIRTLALLSNGIIGILGARHIGAGHSNVPTNTPSKPENPWVVPPQPTTTTTPETPSLSPA
jgi:hypothetical protein